MKGKTRIIAKFHRTNSVICCHSGEGKTLSYTQINKVKVSQSSDGCCNLRSAADERMGES